MKILGGQIDFNDLAFVEKRYGKVLAARPAPRNKNIHPNVTRFLLQSGEVCDVFHIKPVYYEALNGEWRPLGEVTLFHGNRHIMLIPNWYEFMTARFFLWLQQRQKLVGSLRIGGALFSGLQPYHHLFATTTTFFPDAGTGATTVDGGMEYDLASPGAVYATIHDHAGNSASPSGDPIIMTYCQTTTTSNQFTEIDRSMFLFSTSGIGSGQTVSSATFSLSGNAVVQTLGSQTVGVVASTPGSNNTLVASDFNVANFGTTRFATDLNVASWSTTGYNDFTLNASGIAAVNITGISKFGFRQGKDIDNSAPTWASNVIAQTNGHTADAAGTTTDPKLVATYAATATADMRLGFGF